MAPEGFNLLKGSVAGNSKRQEQKKADLEQRPSRTTNVKGGRKVTESQDLPQARRRMKIPGEHVIGS